MKELLRYMKGYWREAIIAPLFKMLEASFELIVPLVMAGIVDVGIKNQDLPYIWRMGAVLVILGVLGCACAVTAQYFAAKAALGFGTQLRDDLFACINRFSYQELDVLGIPVLITRITSDANQVQTGVNMVLRLFLRAPFIVAGAVIMAFTISVRLTIIFLIAVPCISLILYLIVKTTIPIYKKAQKMVEQVSLLTRENHVGARVVRAFSRQKDEMKRFEETTEGLSQFQIYAGKISALMNPATYVVVNLAIMAILWYGGKEVNSGGITQGEVIALINYMMQILLALVALVNLILSFTKALASSARINEVFHTRIHISDDGNTRQEGAPEGKKVEFRHVSFAYAKAGEDSLEDITFFVNPGETLGIIGGTGSGKTTLINLIPRFYDVSKGEILIDGIPIQQYPFAQLRDKIGVVPQRAVLFKGTIRENMQWAKKDATDEEIWRALRIAQAEDVVKGKKGELDAPVLQGGRNFSGGQKQRLTIARALVGAPEILILDDSASALDFATDAALSRALRNHTEGMTVFLVSQRASSMRHADRILVLDDGRMADLGTHEELFGRCGVYREICLSQLSKEEAKRA